NPATNAVTSTISNLPGGGDTLYASSINQHGLSLIGGRDAPNGLPYAAFIQPNATEASAPISSLLTANLIYAVALNDYGQGLIGGFTSTSTAYAAFVDPITNTAMPPISNLPTATGSVIYGVALNNFGQAIVGGTDGTKAYAAFVDPITNRASDPILNIPTTGGSIIYAVGLVMTPQIPSNTLTGNNRIFANYISENAQQDVFYFIPAWINGTLTDALESAAPTRNAVSTYTASNNLFYLAGSSFATHLRNQRKKGIRPETASVASKATVAFAEDELLASLKWWSESRQQKKLQQKPYSEKPYTIWFDAIGVFSYQKAQDQTVGFNPFSGGVVLAFDRVKKNLRSGVGASYLYTHVHEKKGQGHSNINQENLFAYLSWNEYQFYVDGLLLGGLFQTSQVRNIQMTGFNFSQSSKPKGWQLLPHFEFGYNALLPTHRRDLDVDLNPFVMLDWANNWQGDFVETGNGVFGCSQQEQYGSLLRTEVGLRFNETLLFETWALFFLEKMSYVNIHSFNAGRVTASLIGFPGSFTLETLSSDQNLGVAQVEIAFIPLNPHHPSASFFYQGEFGTQYQSHQINAELSWHF
ncbi:MAG TPA: autotransporter outer membrane beta-barrel domain-containing protein, partial [Chlamydiales bacterium]|nr:autotransporter outer membrane beta-barrel domain-containing protein [Chlamydiales bacterium]